jgi:hypothetical protein
VQGRRSARSLPFPITHSPGIEFAVDDVAGDPACRGGWFGIADEHSDRRSPFLQVAIGFPS